MVGVVQARPVGPDAGRDGKVFFVKHGPPNTAFVTEELEGQDITNILSRTRDITGPGYLLWEPLVAGNAALRILGHQQALTVRQL